MPSATYVQTSFLGGEWSQTAQGRTDLPAYRTAMNVCYNSFPLESGAWTRRPGSECLGTTRNGAKGRLISFDFQQNSPYNMEFTDGFLRFWTGMAQVMTNDAQQVTNISTANPAVVTTALAHGWSSANQTAFNGLGTLCPLLQNRAFIITVVSPTTFSIADAITGANIDGSTLGWVAPAIPPNVTRILEIATGYLNGSWSSLRSVQAETETVLLNGTQQPQVLSVVTPPKASQFASFALNPANFIDGPYLDPIPGSLMTPSAVNGIITLTMSLQAYDGTRAYNLGDFVNSVGQGYKSLVGNNQGNTPASSPGSWQAINAGAVLGPSGFLNSDIGRLVRLYSEPPLYASGSAYPTGSIVAFPDVNGASTYWTTTANLAAGIPPGTSTSWSLTPTAAQWTWGRVTAVSGTGLIPAATAIGNMTAGGGLAAAFNGNNTQPFSNSASFTTNVEAHPLFVSSTPYNLTDEVFYVGAFYTCVHNFTIWFAWQTYQVNQVVDYNGAYWLCLKNNAVGITPGFAPTTWQNLGADLPGNTNVWTFSGIAPQPSLDMFVGQHYGSGKTISSVSVYPSTDSGFANTTGLITLNLRASNTLPALGDRGTLLGSASFFNITSPVNITSSDSTSTWLYVWIEMIVAYAQPLPGNVVGSPNVFATQSSISQLLIFSANVNNGSVINVQIEGLPLLYTTTIRTWRLGVYSNTSGWPICGTYHEGRLWLAGSVGNRVDASRSDGNILDFTPTSPYGVVADDNSLSYIFAAPDVNSIFWLVPDQQGIIVGTQAGEWLVQASALNQPLTPTSVQAHRVTKIGCANIEPRRAEHTLLVVQKKQRKIVEYFADVFSGKFTAPNLSDRARHLTVAGIQEIAYQQEITPIMWARCGDGSLIGATYRRDTLTTSQGPTYVGWHRHTFGSARIVESVCVGASSDGNLDALAMVTNDARSNIRHVEILTDPFEETDALANAWFLDDAIVPTSSAVSGNNFIINGLWPLNGKLVTVFAGGLDCGEYTVANGSVTVPFGDGVAAGTANGLFTAAFVASFTTAAMPLVVGFTYTSQGQLVRPHQAAETGARNGPAFGKTRRNHKFALQAVGTAGTALSIGASFGKLDPVLLQNDAQSSYPPSQLFTGVFKDILDDDNSLDGQICWQVSRPLPATLAVVGGFVETQDE